MTVSEFFDPLIAGGPLMVPLLVGLVIAVILTLERGFGLLTMRTRAGSLRKMLRETVREGRVQSAQFQIGSRRGPLAELATVQLDHADDPRLRSLAAARVRARIAERLQRRLSWFRVLMRVTIPLGILGAGLQIVREGNAFGEGASDPSFALIVPLLANALLPILTATAIVTICWPAELICQRAAKRLIFQTEWFAAELEEWLHEAERHTVADESTLTPEPTAEDSDEEFDEEVPSTEAETETPTEDSASEFIIRRMTRRKHRG